MVFESRCKLGKIQVDETTIQVTSFKKVVWSAPKNSVTQIEQKPTASIMAIDLTIYTTQGVYEAPGFIKRHLSKLMELFPGLEAQKPGGASW